MSSIKSNRFFNSHDPHESEMYEFLPTPTAATTATSVDNSNVNEEIGLNISNSFPVNRVCQPQLFSSRHVPKVLHQQISHIRDKISNKIRNNDENEREKNQGYLVVEKSDSGLVLLQNNTLDQESIQCAQSCVNINEIAFDPNRIQYPSRTSSSTNDLLVTQRALFGACTTSAYHYLDDEFSGLLTRPNAQCNTPSSDPVNICDTQISETILLEQTCLTNDSDHEFFGTDRSTLSDQDYIQRQALDLECLKMLEIKLNDQLNSLDIDLYAETELNHLYDEALRSNANLKRQLKELKEQSELISSPWVCKVCSLINEPSIETFRFACAACDSPKLLRGDI